MSHDGLICQMTMLAGVELIPGEHAYPHLVALGRHQPVAAQPVAIPD